MGKVTTKPTPAEPPCPPSIQPPGELLTAREVIAYLRLDAQDGNAGERLRNLVRRHRLPVIRRGRLQLFRKSAVDAWLDAGQRGLRTKHPARLPSPTKARQGVKAK